MKVEVTKRFVDRNTKEMRKVGEIHDYNEERAKELIKNGFVKEVKNPKIAPVQPEEKKG